MLKNLIIVEGHQEVLAAWSKTSKYNVISLDFHTDSHLAMISYSYYEALARLGHENHPDFKSVQDKIQQDEINAYKSKQDTSRAIERLQSDEHLDFAQKAGIINKIFVLAKKNGDNYNSNDNVYSIGNRFLSYTGQGIIEYCPICIPGCQRVPHDDNCVIDVSENSIEDFVLSDALNKFMHFERSLMSNFILDIDCDYFTSTKSLAPKSMNVFADLIKNAKMVTIAKESACVQSCKLNDDRIDSRIICSRIKKIIDSI